MSPDNFGYFIVLFSACFFTGTYILISYKRTWLVLLNSLMFFLCAIKVALEYFTHQIESYDSVLMLQYFSGPVGFSITTIFSLSVYYGVRPFKGFKNENTINWITVTLLLYIPMAIISYKHCNREIFLIHDQKIDGLWKFSMVEGPFLAVFQFYSLVFATVIYMALFVLSIIRDSQNRVNKIIAAVIYTVFPVFYHTLWTPDNGTEYQLANWGLAFYIEALAINWFVSGYRLFDSGFGEASKDLLDSITDLAIQTDHSLNIVNFNISAVDKLGTPQGKIDQFLSTHNGTDRHEVNHILSEVIRNPTARINITLKDPTGKTRIFRIKSADWNWRGKNKGHTFLLNDLTELIEQQNRLEKLNASKDELFSIIAHDLRRPALAFKGITNKVNHLIQKKDFDLLRSLGDSIEKSATQLNALLDNLLKWALSQKEMISIKTQPVNVKALTDDLLKSFELITQEKGITINTSAVDPRLIINTDPDILQTILRNLVDNAIKYSHSDSRVMLSTEVNAERIAISIKDQGIGMTNPQLTGLFTLDKAKSTVGTFGEKGSGLGLNLVLDLVDKTGGELTCNSAPGLGTEMSIVYPVE